MEGNIVARGRKAHGTQKAVVWSLSRGWVEWCGVANGAWIMGDQVGHTKESILNSVGSGHPGNETVFNAETQNLGNYLGD